MSARLAIIACALVALASPAAAAPKGPSKLDQTKHNFFGPGQRSPAPGMDVCQFCHVPQRMRTSRIKPPVWDPKLKGLNAALDQRADPNGPPLSLRWAGSTLRCVSCHDATVSSINITFRPQSGSLHSDGVAGDKHKRNGGASTFMAPPGEWNSRVMGNHPVSIPYPLDLGASEYKGYQPRSRPLTTHDWNPDPRAAGLKLFSDTSGFDALRGSAGIECASCHDPHGTGNSKFLRLPKEGSQLCLACHRK